MKRKIAFVSCAHTRTGTSAMMGMLKLGGFDIGGRKGKINGPNFKNPKGHFELFSFEYGFYRKHFKKHYYTGMAPSLDLVERVFLPRRKEFVNILNSEFGKCPKIALKGFGYLFAPIVYPMRKRHDIKVIQMVRPIADRVASRIRVAKKANKPVNKAVMTAEVKSWDALAAQIVRKYRELDYYTVQFDAFIKSPVETVTSVFSFLKEPAPSRDIILDWVDPKLANRERL